MGIKIVADLRVPEDHLLLINPDVALNRPDIFDYEDLPDGAILCKFKSEKKKPAQQ